MSVDRRQVSLILRNALRMDFRIRGPARERRTRNLRPLAGMLVTNLIVGVTLALTMARGDIPILVRASVVFLAAGIFILLNLMTESNEILGEAGDAEVLGWRPIDSGTLYAARVLHVLTYVGMVTATLLLPACLVLAVRDAAGGLVAAAFALAGALHSVLVAGFVIVLHGALLRRLPAERFQDVLGTVQLVAMLVIVLGFQLLSPELARAMLGAVPIRWIALLPAAWYAMLPALAGGEVPAGSLPAIVAGIAAVLVLGGVAFRRLAPRYQADVSALRIARGAGRVGVRASRLQSAAAWCLGRRPLRRLGFDFFLAQLRGDRRLRVGMMPLVAVPMGLVLSAAIMAKGGDPYAGIVSGTADLEPNAALARGQTLYFTAVYMLAFLTLSSQGAGRSHDWRAGWVYFAAPIRRYDDFCLGVMWGVVYGLLLPAVVAIVLVILLAWRDPLHVAAHVAPPAALALLAVPCALLLDPAPPFSREPLRNLRGRDLALWFIVAFPMFAIGTAHYELRHRPAALVGAGVALALLAMLVWALVARRLRNAFPRNTFEA